MNSVLEANGQPVGVEQELRTSSYTIYVNIPGNDDEMLLVHGYLGSYDKVSRSVVTWLRTLESRNSSRRTASSSRDLDWKETFYRPSEETIATLKQRGYLTRRTVDEEETFFRDFVHVLHESKKRGEPSYIIMPTYSCNLRCHYCFQDSMRTDPKNRHLLRIMSHEMADRILISMPKIEAKHGLDPARKFTRSIKFFGGEPFLAENRDIVDHIIEKARSMGAVNFSGVTNATELDAYEDLLSPELISELQITLDGPPAEHDKRRIYADGSGSFDKIAANITMALKRGVAIQVRLNLDRNNLGDLPSVARVIKEHGWDAYPKFGAYAAPIRAANEKTVRKTTMNSWQLTKALMELRERFPETGLIAPPFNSIWKQAESIFADPERMPATRTSYCGAHDKMYVLDPFGDIYACWEQTGEPSVRLGRITANGNPEMNTAIEQRWRGRTVAANSSCGKCSFSLNCGGGCAIQAEETTGDFNANACDGFQALFRYSVGKTLEPKHEGREHPEAIIV